MGPFWRPSEGHILLGSFCIFYMLIGSCNLNLILLGPSIPKNVYKFQRIYTKDPISRYKLQCMCDYCWSHIRPVKTVINPRWRLAAILKISNSHISATCHPIDHMFGNTVGFTRTSYRTALLPVAPNPRWRRGGHLENLKWIYFWEILSELPHVWYYFRFCMVSGSNGAISGWIKSNMASGGHSDGHISASDWPHVCLLDGVFEVLLSVEPHPRWRPAAIATESQIDSFLISKTEMTHNPRNGSTP